MSVSEREREREREGELKRKCKYQFCQDQELIQASAPKEEFPCIIVFL